MGVDPAPGDLQPRQEVKEGVASSPSSSMNPASESTTFSFERAELSMQSSTSPFPPAELLAGYKDVMPGLEERVIALIEGENKNRQSMQKKEQKPQSRIFERGGQPRSRT